MSDLCRAYGISRKTGYKWFDRYQQEGPSGLIDRSCAPVNHPNAISDQVQASILLIKKRFGKWGPAKIRVRLKIEHPQWSSYPAVSTIGAYLKRNGLVISRKRRRRASPTESPLTVGTKSNDVWCVDFKGHFQTSDGTRCNPLTISDHISRYLLCCRHLDHMSYALVKMQFERVFREFGLPLVIRSDNGSPFSGRGLCGLSRLSYWWIRLGIHPERIQPGNPQQNGRHERMHKTLKDHTAKPPGKNLVVQQRKFDGFCVEYNDYRPHESLSMQTPGSQYISSCRTYPARLAELSYPDNMKVSRIMVHGDAYYLGRRLFITECLTEQHVGFERIDADISDIWYCNYKLGTLDHRSWQITASPSLAFSSGVNPRRKEP